MRKNLIFKKNTIKQIDLENLQKQAYVFCLATKNISSLLDFNNKKNIAFEAWNEEELVTVLVLANNFEIKLFATKNSNFEQNKAKKLLDFAQVNAYKFNADFLTIYTENIANDFLEFLQENGFKKSKKNALYFEFDVSNLNKKPKLTICTITYQHANYIAEAIESFLSQVTDFIYEIIIHDDASPDGTGKIVNEYAKKYPRLITAIVQNQNQHSQGISVSWDIVWPMAKGKYIAICEGDDYWIDDFKLQNQVDFLENNLDYGLVHTNHVEFFQNHQKFVADFHKRRFCPAYDNDTTLEDLIETNFISTLTTCIRTDILLKTVEKCFHNKRKYLMEDYPIWLEIARICKIRRFNKQTAVYRVLSESASKSQSHEKQLKFLRSTYEVRFDFIKKYGCSKHCEDKVSKSFQKYLIIYSYLTNNSKLANEAIEVRSNLKGLKIKYKLFYFLTKTALGRFLLQIIKKNKKK